MFDRGRAGLVATAVQFEVGGETFTARASREVILSAGTVQTPHLLELSGMNGRTNTAHGL